MIMDPKLLRHRAKGSRLRPKMVKLKMANWHPNFGVKQR